MDSEENDLENADKMSTVPSVGGRVGKVLDAIDAVFIMLSTLALAGILVVVMLQIIGRFVLPSPPIWTAETSKYLLIYMTAMATGLTIRKSRNVNIELFQPWLGMRGLAIYQAGVCTVMGVFAAIVLPYAWTFAKIGVFQHSPTLDISMFYIFVSIVILFAFVLIYSVIAVGEAINALIQNTPEKKSTAAKRSLSLWN